MQETKKILEEILKGTTRSTEQTEQATNTLYHIAYSYIRRTDKD